MSFKLNNIFNKWKRGKEMQYDISTEREPNTINLQQHRINLFRSFSVSYGKKTKLTSLPARGFHKTEGQSLYKNSKFPQVLDGKSISSTNNLNMESNTNPFLESKSNNEFQHSSTQADKIRFTEQRQFNEGDPFPVVNKNMDSLTSSLESWNDMSKKSHLEFNYKDSQCSRAVVDELYLDTLRDRTSSLNNSNFDLLTENSSTDKLCQLICDSQDSLGNSSSELEEVAVHGLDSVGCSSTSEKYTPPSGISSPSKSKQNFIQKGLRRILNIIKNIFPGKKYKN